MAKAKIRLDRLLLERGLVSSRTQAQAVVMAGEVRVSGETAVKPSMMVPVDAELELLVRMPYASRGGFKLVGALETFDISPYRKVCADVGACTGGFTDVLLQNGAARVYAIDVGYGQLDWKIRQDNRVIVMERTNARYLRELPEPIELVTIDVSFISIRLILPTVRQWLSQNGEVLALIKPQFEAGRKYVGKGGIVRDPAVHRQVLTEILTWALENEYVPLGLIRSPIEGTDGNVEFFVWLQSGKISPNDLNLNIDAAVNLKD